MRNPGIPDFGQVHTGYIGYHWTSLSMVSGIPAHLKRICLDKYIPNEYSETCLNQTSLGSTFVFRIDRFSVYIGLNNKDFYIGTYTGFRFRFSLDRCQCMQYIIVYFFICIIWSKLKWAFCLSTILYDDHLGNQQARCTRYNIMW